MYDPQAPVSRQEAAEQWRERQRPQRMPTGRIGRACRGRGLERGRLRQRFGQPRRGRDGDCRIGTGDRVRIGAVVLFGPGVDIDLFARGRRRAVLDLGRDGDFQRRSTRAIVNDCGTGTGKQVAVAGECGPARYRQRGRRNEARLEVGVLFEPAGRMPPRPVAKFIEFRVIEVAWHEPPEKHRERLVVPQVLVVPGLQLAQETSRIVARNEEVVSAIAIEAAEADVVLRTAEGFNRAHFGLLGVEITDHWNVCLWSAW